MIVMKEKWDCTRLSHLSMSDPFLAAAKETTASPICEFKKNVTGLEIGSRNHWNRDSIQFLFFWLITIHAQFVPGCHERNREEWDYTQCIKSIKKCRKGKNVIETKEKCWYFHIPVILIQFVVKHSRKRGADEWDCNYCSETGWNRSQSSVTKFYGKRWRFPKTESECIKGIKEYWPGMERTTNRRPLSTTFQCNHQYLP